MYKKNMSLFVIMFNNSNLIKIYLVIVKKNMREKIVYMFVKLVLINIFC